MAVLVIDGLRVDVAGDGPDIVDEVNLEIAPGEVVGLVGESGSGKTTVGLAVLGHARKGVRVVQGSVSINGREMLTLKPQQLRQARGDLVSYVPQDPSTALNPALRIGKQLMEVLEYHDFGGSDQARRDRVDEVMAEVLLPSTRHFLRRYPHQLSGGQQQRVGLAMAFACRPAVIVLDEPTTGLDVSTQAHVLETVRDLCRRHGVAALYVTHDLAVVANLADRVAVMYAGRVVESGPTTVAVRQPRPPLLPAPDRRRPGHHRTAGHRGAGRPGAVTGASTRRLRVRASLRAGHRGVHDRLPAGGRGGRRPRGPLRAAMDGAGADGGRPRLPARTDRSGRRHARRAGGFGVLRRPPGRAGHRSPRREGRMPGAGR